MPRILYNNKENLHPYARSLDKDSINETKAQTLSIALRFAWQHRQVILKANSTVEVCGDISVQ